MSVNMEDIRYGFKILTHDWKPPLRGGRALCNGTFPKKLRKVALNTSAAECGAGFNYCASIAEGFRIAGIWRDGRPARVVLVEAAADAIERGSKRRASSLTLIREATDDEIAAGILEFSQRFGVHAAEMANEQVLWRRALARPGHNVKAVQKNLREALEKRGLAQWRVKRYGDAWAAGTAWAARDAWATWAARDAWATWAARANWAAWATWAARDARAALTLHYAVLMRWVEQPADLLTTGIRDAYANGAAIVLPTGEKELGFAMDPGAKGGE